MYLFLLKNIFRISSRTISKLLLIPQEYLQFGDVSWIKIRNDTFKVTPSIRRLKFFAMNYRVLADTMQAHKPLMVHTSIQVIRST